ncbi:hypothetical protein F4810DRAFT_684129 [Camillea tinctor]|nr:hypothetical protein F4810DRAFT_684129 [Camillea tinctor]
MADLPCPLSRSRARAIGRTPAEHAALEQALERRRARRAAEAARMRSVIGTSPTSASATPGGGAGSRRMLLSLVHGYRAAKAARLRSPAEEPAAKGGDERGLGEDESEYCFAAPPKRHSVDPFDHAMQRMREEVGEAPPAQTPPRVDGARRCAGSTRKVRGAGWHRRGYRDLGCMWINVKEGTKGPVRGQDVREDRTLRGFVRDVFASHASSSLYDSGLHCDLFFRKKSLIRMLVDLENEGRSDEETLVCDYFDGGETVYIKAYDTFGHERSLCDW